MSLGGVSAAAEDEAEAEAEEEFSAEAASEVCVDTRPRPAEKVGGKWLGVSLGGWLLMEPGPSKDLFRRFPGPDGQEARCEWELMENLRGKEDGLNALREHRETYIGLEDFHRIRSMGLNAVRIPFGYWIVRGPIEVGPQHVPDPYEGPALEYLDRAVDWAEQCGLQVLLDLHGCPGGESGEAPSGRRQRLPGSKWQWRRWRFSETLRVLRTVAERYRDRAAVTGMAVCNEPSPEVPVDVLCRFYDRAVAEIRGAGMDAERVSVVLPVFQRSMEGFMRQWEEQLDGRQHENVCFEVHWYHCFENEWHGRTFAQHLRAVQEHTAELRRYPMVVGEWSLALGSGAQPGKVSKDDMRALFAHAQLAAYQEASHGWFFWTWNDQHGIDWDWRQSFEGGYLPLNTDLHRLPELPPISKSDGEAAHDDPLETMFDAPACDPRVRMGDTVYLRAFNGRYLDVEGAEVRARYGDRGRWQQFVLSPCEDPSAAVEPASLQSGDVACLLAHNGRYLGVNGDQLEATERKTAAHCAFTVHVEASPEVRHRSAVFLQSLTTSKVLAPNESDVHARDQIVARWSDFGPWQRLIVEKPLSTICTPRRPRRRSSFPGLPSPAPRKSLEGGTPLRRRSSTGGGASTPLRRRSSTSGSSEDAPPRPRRSSSAGAAPAQHECATPVRRRRSSVGAGRSSADDDDLEEEEDDEEEMPVKKRRGSLGPAELAGPSTPTRRRSSAASKEQPAGLATPARRKSGAAFAELSGLPTPSRRRSSA